MKIGIKLKILIFVTAIMSFAICLCVTMGLKPAQAAVTYHTFGDLAEEKGKTFALKSTANLRTNGDGFNFKAQMDKDTSDAIEEDPNKTVYFILIPSVYKETIGDLPAHRAVAREKDSSSDNYGEYMVEKSLCLYVKAVRSVYDGVNDCYYYWAGVSNLAAVNQQSENYTAYAVIETRNGTKAEKNLAFEYTYATATTAPSTNIYNVITSSILNTTEDYSAEIAEYYDWYGDETTYPLNVTSLEEYNTLIDKVNAGFDLNTIAVRHSEDYASKGGTAITAENVYTVKFVDEKDCVVKAYTAKSGATITAPATGPDKEATATHTYFFSGWGDVATTVVGSATYTVQYDAYKNIYDFAGYKSIASDAVDGVISGKYTLTADIDCEGARPSDRTGFLGAATFDGVLEGNGHTIYNAKGFTSGTYSRIFFGNIGENGVVRNIGFYNIESGFAEANFTFALAIDVYGTLENISFHQSGANQFTALFRGICGGANISNVVVHSSNTVYGFTQQNTNLSSITRSNVYMFSNAINPASESYASAAAGTYFNSGETGKYYRHNATFNAINFASKFDYSDVWERDTELGIPLIKRPAALNRFIEVTDLSDLKTKITADNTGKYILTQDIDCNNGKLSLGDFYGILDGNGYNIKNVYESNNGYNGLIFSKIWTTAIIRNIGFYNITGAGNNTFGLAVDLYGTIENVSMYINSSLTGLIFRIHTSIGDDSNVAAKINNFVVYGNTGRLYNAVKKDDNSTNGYAPYLKGNNNYAITTATSKPIALDSLNVAYFITGNYTTDEEFNAINFADKFDCSDNGIWEIDETLRIPLVKRA